MVKFFYILEFYLRTFTSYNNASVNFVSQSSIQIGIFSIVFLNVKIISA